MTKKKKSPEERQIERETRQQLRLDPIAASERYRAQLEMEVDKALEAVSASGDGLLKAVEAHRVFTGFSHDLAEATGRRMYEVRRGLHERLGSDFLKRQLMVLRHGGSLPAVKMPALAKRTLEAIRDQQGPRAPKIIEGEDAWHETAHEARQRYGVE